MNSTLKIGIVGLGTVGSGTLQVLKRNAKHIEKRSNTSINIAYVASRNVQKTQNLVDELFAQDEAKPKVLNHVQAMVDTDVDLIIELMGGMDDAYLLIKAALSAKKHVITANKALLAQKGHELFQLAQENQVILAFEAAVAGGIPIIKTLREGFSANQIQSIIGIINGTSNFILSKMSLDSLSFSAALSEAQALGYAEADPTFDVAGIDAAHKITIMASLAFGIELSFDKAHIEGIEFLQIEDINYAKQLGLSIKLLGIARQHSAGIQLSVYPCLIPTTHILANVHQAMNAVLVSGDAVGESLLYGKGAGSEPTASAVIADLVDITRHRHQLESHVPAMGFHLNTLEKQTIVPLKGCLKSSYYLRLNVVDEAGVLALITSTLAGQNISVETMLQKANHNHLNQTIDVVMVTHECLEVDFIQAFEQFKTHILIKQAHFIRVMYL